jgi:L-asparaginase II
VVDAAGKRRVAIGDVETPIFARSAVKAIQALPLVESGAAERYGFGPAELALACASHNGESRHVEGVRRMLAAAGRGEADLECGAHWPLDRDAANHLVRAGAGPAAVHNNCSGKHAGFICTACHLGIDPAGYVGPEHPVQREVTAVLASLTGAPLGPEVRGIDGCSIPAYAISLDRLARAFARLATGEGLSPARAAAARALLRACMAEPYMVAGTGRFCTREMTRLGERLFVKAGGEAVFCAAFPELGLGVAVKCDDGAKRAAESMMSAVIAVFLPMTAGDDPFQPSPLVNWAGKNVGEIRPASALVVALREGRPQPI